jgi:hypothetical protein
MSDEYIDEAATGTGQSQNGQNPEVDSIWLTKPSFKPILLAASFLLAFIGLFAFRPLMYVAIVAILWISIAWISESREESDELPLS